MSEADGAPCDPGRQGLPPAFRARGRRSRLGLVRGRGGAQPHRRAAARPPLATGEVRAVAGRLRPRHGRRLSVHRLPPRGRSSDRPVRPVRDRPASTATRRSGSRSASASCGAAATAPMPSTPWSTSASESSASSGSGWPPTPATSAPNGRMRGAASKRKPASATRSTTTAGSSTRSGWRCSAGSGRRSIGSAAGTTTRADPRAAAPRRPGRSDRPTARIARRWGGVRRRRRATGRSRPGSRGRRCRRPRSRGPRRAG